MTVGNAGLGKLTIEVLARHFPSRIYLVGRNAAKCNAAIESIKSTNPSAPVRFLECDLASLASVAIAARNFTSENKRLDILICNAGLMDTNPGLTSDGYEKLFGINYLGHALLIKLLLPTMELTSTAEHTDVRIVSLTSTAAAIYPWGGIQFDQLHTTQPSLLFGAWHRYGQSKLAVLLHAVELARRHPAVTIVAVHPGAVKTDMVGNLSWANRALVYATNIGRMLSPEEGVLNPLWAATAPRADVESGGYYEPVGQRGKLDKQWQGHSLTERLWNWTQMELEAYSVDS